MIAARLQRTPGKIAIDETLVVASGFLFRQLEDLLMQRRQRAGRIGIGGVAGQCEGLAAAAAEIDFPELAALARLRHPPRAAITIKSLGILPDPGDRMVRSH